LSGQIFEEAIDQVIGHQNLLENFRKLSVYLGELREILTLVVDFPWHIRWLIIGLADGMLSFNS